MKPAIMRSSVVLPQPEGPRMEKKLPRSTAKDSESTAVWLANRLATASARRSGTGWSDIPELINSSR